MYFKESNEDAASQWDITPAFKYLLVYYCCPDYFTGFISHNHYRLVTLLIISFLGV